MKVSDQGHFFTFYLKLNDELFFIVKAKFYMEYPWIGGKMFVCRIWTAMLTMLKKTTSSESCSVASAIGLQWEIHEKNLLF